MKPKVYLETTIPSYLTARPSRDLVTAAHQQITREWWDTRRHDFDLFVSQMVIDEASAGDPEAATRRLDVLASLPLLDPQAEGIALAQMLIDHILSPAKGCGRCAPHCHRRGQRDGLPPHVELYPYCQCRIAGAH